MSSIVIIGNLTIALSLGISLFGFFAYGFGRRLQSDQVLSLGRACLYANFVLMTVANLGMIHGLLVDDFSVSYVAQVGSRETPRWISAISLWSSLEGSLLFWGWILAAYGATAAYLYRDQQKNMMAWAGMTMLLVEFFFLFPPGRSSQSFSSCQSCP